MSNYALSLTRECQTLSCSGQRNVKFRDILDKGMSNSPLSCTMDDQIPCYSWQWILKIHPLLDKRFSIPSYPRKLILKFRSKLDRGWLSNSALSSKWDCQTPCYPHRGIVKLCAILTMGLSNSILTSPWGCQTPHYPHHGIVKLHAILIMGLSNSALPSPWDCQTQR